MPSHVIHLNSWGSYENDLTKEFDLFMQELCVTKIQAIYHSSKSYWNTTFHVGNYYPNFGLCMSIPHIYLHILIKFNIPIDKIATMIENMSIDDIDSHLINIASYNLILDELLYVIEPPPYDPYCVFTSTRTSLDNIYSCILALLD